MKETNKKEQLLLPLPQKLSAYQDMQRFVDEDGHPTAEIFFADADEIKDMLKIPWDQHPLHSLDLLASGKRKPFW